MLLYFIHSILMSNKQIKIKEESRLYTVVNGEDKLMIKFIHCSRGNEKATV